MEEGTNIELLASRATDLRKSVKQVAEKVFYLKNDLRTINNLNDKLKGESVANAMLSYRHLEDASMRLGKVLQALSGGESIYGAIGQSDTGKTELRGTVETCQDKKAMPVKDIVMTQKDGEKPMETVDKQTPTDPLYQGCGEVSSKPKIHKAPEGLNDIVNGNELEEASSDDLF